MPQSNKSIWFRIGYWVERARMGTGHADPVGLPARVASLGLRKISWPHREKVGSKRPPRENGVATKRASEPLTQALGVAGAGALALKILDSIPSQRRPGLGGLARAGAAGAVAGIFVRAIALLRRDLDEQDPVEGHVVDALVVGFGRGLLYGRVIEPRLPGHRIIRGLTYGLLEVGLEPWGGLNELLAPLAPHHKIPLLRAALGERHAFDGDYVDHLIFGATMSLLYDPRPSASMGIVVE